MGLSDNIIILLETKSLNDFSLHSLLVTVAWRRSKTNAELLMHKITKGLWRLEHYSVRLINKNQRVFLGDKVTPNVVLNFVFVMSSKQFSAGELVGGEYGSWV